MSKAVVFFAEGTEECEALLVADLLRRARVEVIIASAMGRRALVSSHGIHLNADALAEENQQQLRSLGRGELPQQVGLF